MAALTKAQLAAQLEASNVSYATLVAKYESLQGDLYVAECLVAQLSAPTPTPVVPTTVALTPYRQALALAKAQALRSGKCVSVTAR